MQTEESTGLRAVCHQHEIDQLNGLFWIKRLSRLKRERLIKRFEKVSRSSDVCGIDGINSSEIQISGDAPQSPTSKTLLLSIFGCIIISSTKYSARVELCSGNNGVQWIEAVAQTREEQHAITHRGHQRRPSMENHAN